MKLSKRQRGLALGGGMTAIEALFLKRRSGKLLGLRTIVRCHRGHLFTTTWIPGASVKALRLGPLRVQRCPVGKHWSVVRPVEPMKLSETERADARAVRDTLLP
ncbi:MAG TPA: hypothetical protein VHU61_10715 [Solirubrobacteraceae bacterium]|jgi:hypothetical protein|nr:hypothetical protein [Solirubrobacteraceae bacterium]